MGWSLSNLWQDKLSNKEIISVNIPTGVPLLYTFDINFNVIDKKYLIESEKNYPVSFNGKTKFTINLSLDLDTNEIEKIAKIEINNFIERLKEIDYDVKIDGKVLKFISVKGFDKEFGARPIKRAIQKHLEDPLAKKIVSGKIKKGDKIKISHIKDSESLDIKIS